MALSRRMDVRPGTISACGLAPSADQEADVGLPVMLRDILPMVPETAEPPTTGVAFSRTERMRHWAYVAAYI